jgi:hypothetical protein
MDETINVYLDSSKANKSNTENSFNFRISPGIDIKNDEFCEVYVQNFSCINGIPNIRTDKTDTLTFKLGSGEHESVQIPEGYYSGAGLAAVLNEEFLSNLIPLSIEYIDEQIKFKLIHTTAANFTLITTQNQLVNLLQFETGVENAGEIESKFTVDLNSDSHNLFLTVPEFYTNSRVNGTSDIAPNSICRIPIVSAFGNYNVFQANNPVQKFMLRQKNISSLSVQLLTDSGDIFTPGKWSASLVFTIKSLPKNEISDDLRKALENFVPTTTNGTNPFPPNSNYNLKTKDDYAFGKVRKNPYWL